MSKIKTFARNLLTPFGGFDAFILGFVIALLLYVPLDPLAATLCWIIIVWSVAQMIYNRGTRVVYKHKEKNENSKTI